MTWTPETNRVPFGLLTTEEKAALQACEHGWEIWIHYIEKWGDRPTPCWSDCGVYRAKPAPKRVVVWLHWCKGTGSDSTFEEETAKRWINLYGGWLKRIECDEDGGNVVVTDEVL